MLAYTWSQNQSCFQKFFAVYFKFCGITAKGFNTLHAMALTMSYKWTCNAVLHMSNHAMQEVTGMLELEKYAEILFYDNL